jgi:Predicted transcriptional regulator
VTKNITGLSPKEAEFLSSLARDGKSIFTVEEARRFWGDPSYTTNALARLEEKGWLHRLERGTYMLIQLEAGPEREWVGERTGDRLPSHPAVCGGLLVSPCTTGR